MVAHGVTVGGFLCADLEALFDEDGSGSDGEDDGDASGAASGDAGGEVKPRTFAHRFRKLNRAIVDVLDDYSMVGYRALDIRVRCCV